MGFIDEVLQIIRSATSNNIMELRIKKLVHEEGQWEVGIEAPLETVRHICDRLHISSSKFRRRWPRRPKGHGTSEVGPSGRIIHVQSDAETDKHLRGTSHLGELTPEQIVSVTIRLSARTKKGIRPAAATKAIEKLSKAVRKRS